MSLEDSQPDEDTPLRQQLDKDFLLRPSTSIPGAFSEDGFFDLWFFAHLQRLDLPWGDEPTPDVRNHLRQYERKITPEQISQDLKDAVTLMTGRQAKDLQYSLFEFDPTQKTGAKFLVVWWGTRSASSKGEGPFTRVNANVWRLDFKDTEALRETGSASTPRDHVIQEKDVNYRGRIDFREGGAYVDFKR